MALALHPTQERVMLYGVTWETFTRLLADRGDHAGLRLAYNQGTVELTMPSAEHETITQWLVLIVDAIALARDLHLLNGGSTTFTRADLARGAAPASTSARRSPGALGPPWDAGNAFAELIARLTTFEIGA